MASRFVTIKTSGFKEFQNKLKGLPKQLKHEVGGETYAAAKQWERLAKQAAPADQGRLRGAIRGEQTGPLSSHVVVNIDYAAYLEWGTKTKVQIPSELQSYASTFRGGGHGSGKAKEMIYAWMKRVGIPEERQWFVFISIIVNGIKPQPFFFIQRPIVERGFIQNVQRILNTPH